jgi:hypothetical protein
MDAKLNSADVPANIRRAIHSLRAVDSIAAVLDKQGGIGFCETRMEVTKVWEEYMDELPISRHRKFMDDYCYVPMTKQIARKPMVLIKNRKVSIKALATPRSLIFLERRQMFTLFIDRKMQKVIVSHVPANHIRKTFRKKINNRIRELVKSKPSTKCSAKRSGTGMMKSFGWYN